MSESARARIVIVALLLSGHALLFPLYAQQPTNPEAWVLPMSGEFTDAPAQYLGDRVVTGGIVQSVDPVVIKVTTTTGTHELTIEGGDLATPAVGDKVRVYGILANPQTI